MIIDFKLFTKEVVEDPFADSPVYFHEVSQAIKILSGRYPVRFLRFFCLLTGIIKPKKAALWGNRKET